MQRGHSKDHRPDLPQLKLMAAANPPATCWRDIVPGQSADDRVSPLIRRVRSNCGSTVCCTR
jgi:transposase